MKELEMNYLEIKKASYTSTPEPVSPLSKRLPSFVFYCRFIGVVVQAAYRAKKGRYPDDVWGLDSLRILRLLEDAGLRFNITGFDHMEHLGRPCVFIGNHMSIMETLVLPAIVLPYTRVTFVVKESLLHYPVFKHVMRSRNPVAVTRQNPRQDLKTVLSEGSERLSNGISVIVFPQTTRSTGFDAEHFGSIGTKLARKADAPIIPVALKTDAWQNGKWSKDFGGFVPDMPVNIAFGEPITISGKGTAEHQQIVDFITGKLDEWR
jgi:1-acyl-sn-glycerol-3-phosphate acyltransferase